MSGFLLSAGNASGYLAARTGAPRGPWSIRELGGGVSNVVLLVESPGCRFVLKQSLAKLRVEQEWLAARERIHRECAALRDLAPVMPAGSIPEVLFDDPENFLFAMSAAGQEARDWKSRLMAGEAREEIAARVASLLAAQIRASWLSPEWKNKFGDQTNFDQLRIDPYYRSTAARHPDLASRFHALIGAMWSRRCALTHGDWSPKNFLVAGEAVTAIDYEVIHYGDPSFDAAFLLNHLVLKSFHLPAMSGPLGRLMRRFWETLRSEMPRPSEWFEAATLEHLGCLLLARVDGKSPAEYLGEDTRARVRRFARRLVLDRPASVAELARMVERDVIRSSAVTS
jgi:5-methylthioribose kinase